MKRMILVLVLSLWSVACLASTQVLFFHAGWCEPCQKMLPAMQELAKEGRATLVDVDKWGDLTRQWKVVNLPTLILHVDGAEKQRLIGLQSREQMAPMLAAYQMAVEEQKDKPPPLPEVKFEPRVGDDLSKSVRELTVGIGTMFQAIADRLDEMTDKKSRVETISREEQKPNEKEGAEVKDIQGFFGISGWWWLVVIMVVALFFGAGPKLWVGVKWAWTKFGGTVSTSLDSQVNSWLTTAKTTKVQAMLRLCKTEFEGQPDPESVKAIEALIAKAAGWKE